MTSSGAPRTERLAKGTLGGGSVANALSTGASGLSETWNSDSLKISSSSCDGDGGARSGNHSDGDGDRMAVVNCRRAVEPHESAGVMETPDADPIMPGEVPKLPAAELVVPVMPPGDPVMPHDGHELPAAEQDTPVREQEVTSPPDTTARTAQRRLATYIRGPDDDAHRTSGGTIAQTRSLARERELRAR